MLVTVACCFVLLLSHLIAGGTCQGGPPPFGGALPSLDASATLLQIKQGILFDEMDVTYAEWRLDFNESLFVHDPPPCAAGLCAQSLAPGTCLCDWVTCSHPPACASQCASQAQLNPLLAELCSNNSQSAASLWLSLEPDVESPVLTLHSGQIQLVRFNWRSSCNGYRVEIVPLSGTGLLAFLHTTLTEDFLAAKAYCAHFGPHDTSTTFCPSSSCFTYGTHFLRIERRFAEPLSITYSLRIRPSTTEPGPRRTVSPPDAPLAPPVSFSPATPPLQFSVPVDVALTPFQFSQTFQLSTSYCGMLGFQVEPVLFFRPRLQYAISVVPIGPPSPSPDAFVFFDGTQKGFYVCPAIPSDLVVLFISIVRYYPDYTPSEIQYYAQFPEQYALTVEYQRAALDWRLWELGSPAGNTSTSFSSLSPFPPLSFQTNWASNALALQCPTASVPNASQVVFKCQSSSDVLPSCSDFFFAHPGDPSLIGLWPAPQALTSAAPTLFEDLTYAIQPTQPRTFGAVLLLSSALAQRSILQTLGADWAQLLPQCTLQSFHGSAIGTNDGRWLRGSFGPLAITESACDLLAFLEVSQHISELADSILINPGQAIALRYQADLQQFESPWIACVSQVKQLTTEQPIPTRLDNSVACLNSSAVDDPCCNFALSWTECCQPRTIVGELLGLTADANLVEASCAHASCIDPLLQEFAQSQNLVQRFQCSTPLLGPLKAESYALYAQCRDRFIPVSGASCDTDADCQGYCDHFKRHCVVADPLSSYQLFFQCLADALPSNVRISWSTMAGFGTQNATAFARSLFLSYVEPGCVDADLGISYSAFQAGLIPTDDIAWCAIYDRLFADSVLPIPYWSDLRSASLCSALWRATPVPTPTTCLDQSLVCNWDPSLTSTECLAGPSFCAVCETPASCQPVPGVTSEAECSALGQVCLLPGQPIAPSSAGSCQQLQMCTDVCGSVACSSEQQCLAESGHCEDSEHIYDALGDPNAIGFCARPMPPYNTPDCSVLELGPGATSTVNAIPTSFGCVVLSFCTGSNPGVFQCTPFARDPFSCQSIGGTWQVRATDRTACEATQRCNDPPFLSSISRLGASLLTPKPADQCTACDATIIPINSWSSGRWISSDPRTPQWIQPSIVSSNRFSDAVNFLRLSTDLAASIIAATAFQQLNDLECNYRVTQQTVSALLCDCADLTSSVSNTTTNNTTANNTNCFDVFEDTLGIVQACPNRDTFVSAFPLSLTVYGDQIDPTVDSFCLSFTLNRIRAIVFNPPIPPSVSTGFVAHHNGDVRNYRTAINHHNQVVGQVLGDTIVMGSNDFQYLDSVYACVAVSPAVDTSTDPSFVAFDFAVPLTDQVGFVRPLGLTLLPNSSSVSTQICGTIPVSGTANLTFVPIRRVTHWESHSSDLSSGERGLLYVVASLYAILGLAIFILIITLLFLWRMRATEVTFAVWFILFPAVVIRATYFFLVAGEQLGGANVHDLLEFFMIDFPMILFLIIHMLVCLSFMFVLLSQRWVEYSEHRYFWTLFGILAFLLIMLFIGVLIAFAVLVTGNEAISGPLLCPVVTDDSAVARRIRVVYESFIVGISFIIALSELFFGIKLWTQIRAPSKRSREFSNYYLLAIAFLLASTLMCDATAWLIYYIIQEPTPYFAIVLIFTEILPFCALVGTLGHNQLSRAFDSFTSSSDSHDDLRRSPRSSLPMQSLAASASA